jgi:hypothetical protein
MPEDRDDLGRRPDDERIADARRRAADRDDLDDLERYPEDGPAYPRSVQAAGVIWIIMGSLILLNGAVNLLMHFAAGPRGPSARGRCAA